VRIVVDASVALKWVIGEPGSESATALRDDELIAPNLWLAEAASALWRRVRLRELGADEAFRRMAELAGAPVASLPLDPYVETALKIATETSHPLYDCLYAAVAMAHDTYVVTADRRFAAAAALPPLAGKVRLLGAP
jgi:predicted nucleic acid-binding protein